MGTVPTPTPFEAVAAELAASPDLIEALLAEHRDDGTGHCQTCTTPGTGTHAVPMPCSLRQLAEYAVTLGERAVSGPEGERRTVVAVVVDDRGWMICGSIDGVAVDSPKPQSAAAAANCLRLLLPDLFGDEPQHLTPEIAKLDDIADERLGGDAS